MSPPLPARPLSIEPVLARLADARCSRHGYHRCQALACDRAVAEHLGVSRRVVQRYKAEGLTIWIADQLAAALNAHPAELWGLAAWNAAQDAHELHLEELNA